MLASSPVVDRIAEQASWLEAIEAEMIIRDGGLRAFVEKVWPIVEPTTKFVGNWHIDVLCDLLEQVGRGELKDVVINVPPGTMKSLLVNVIFPAWLWARDPSKRFLTASYGAHLTIRDNLRLRNILKSDWYQRHYDVKFVADQDAKGRFDTTARGWRIATSVDGIGTGEHPDFLIIDDPTSADEARSDLERQRANDWFDRTISSRGLSRNVAIILVMQRLHEEDLSGHLLAQGNWEHVCFPMRYEKCVCRDDKPCAYHKTNPSWRADPRDPRTEEGQLLWPELFTEEKVRKLELRLGPYGTAGQLQQRPSPEGGGLFKREWFKYVAALPKDITRSMRGWDTASTEDGGDYSSSCKLHETVGENVIVETVWRGQVSPDGLDKVMRATAESDGIAIPQREGKEPAAAGVAVGAARSKLLKGFDYALEPTTGDKVTRSKPFRAQVEAGNVYLLRTGDPVLDAWIEPFIAELCAFPTGKKDDQVDAASTSYNQLLLELPRIPSLVW